MNVEISWNAGTSSADIATYNGPAEKAKAHGTLLEVDGETPSPFSGETDLYVIHEVFQKNTLSTAERTGFPALAYSFHTMAGKYVVLQVTNNERKARAVTVEGDRVLHHRHPGPEPNRNPGVFRLPRLSPAGRPPRVWGRPHRQVRRGDITVSLYQYR